MRYAAIRNFDVTNGVGNGVSLFVQGCPFHCKGCFNPETWDFNGGKEWTEETEKRFFELIGRDYIHRVSFLGGEPLADENVSQVHNIVKSVRSKYPDKQIWVYTGHTFEEAFLLGPEYECDEATKERHSIMFDIDVLVDGRFKYDKRDLTLAFRGSSNQRIIDVQSSLKTGNVVLYELNI